MKTLRRLGLSLTLISVLAVAAFAGDTNSPPCAPPDPGSTNSPPCAVAQNLADDSTAPDLTSTSPSVVSDEYSMGQLAVEIAQHWLSIY